VTDPDWVFLEEDEEEEEEGEALEGTGGPAATALLDGAVRTTRTPASAALWGCSPLTQEAPMAATLARPTAPTVAFLTS
jgi:hypothetical protein